jgi:alpha-ribazole phosphatase/probable phosphoglycerate mutase
MELRSSDLMLEIIFETHSISLDNERGIATGWNDSALSEAGKRAAGELGLRHLAQPPSAVFTSDLGRAVETADIAFGASDIPIIRDPRLRECNYGELNGTTVDLLEAQRARHIAAPFPGGQSYHQVVEAMQDFLSEIAEGWRGTHVVIIGHSATRWALDNLVNGVPLEESVTAPFNWQPGWRYVLD